MKQMKLRNVTFIHDGRNVMIVLSNQHICSFDPELI